MNPVAVLLASVAHFEQVEQGVEAFAKGLAAQLVTWANEPAAILAIAADLDAKAKAAGDFIVANTPSAPASSVSDAANAAAKGIVADPSHPNNAGPDDPASGTPTWAQTTPVDQPDTPPNGDQGSAPPPAVATINSISPSTGKPGDLVNISGSGFDNAGIKAIMFGAIPSASWTVQDDSNIVNIVLPDGTGGVSVVIIDADGVSSNATSFSFIAPSAVDGSNPAGAPAPVAPTIPAPANPGYDPSQSTANTMPGTVPDGQQADAGVPVAPIAIPTTNADAGSVAGQTGTVAPVLDANGQPTDTVAADAPLATPAVAKAKKGS